jgi:mono/diheme cytochrome c family protein
MSQHGRCLIFFLAAGLVAFPTVRGDDKPAAPVAGCPAVVDNFFDDEVWAKVGQRSCLACHRKGGDAEETKFILVDPRKVEGTAREEAMRHNRAAYTRMAGVMEKDQSKMLLKVVGELDHGGSDVLKPDSAGYRILAEFVRRVNSPRKGSAEIALDPKAPPFFKDVLMMEDRRLLRRVTLSLAGRLPTETELAAISKDGLKTMPALLDAIMKEDAFYDRLQEAFNDIFLTLGVDGNPDQSVLSYEHFEKTRLWYQKFDLSHIKDENERRKAGYKLANDYRKALLEEPMKLIEYIVRNDRPFTEIVTADYIMVSPYTSRGYGIFEELKSKFKNPEDPFEFIPVKLKALKGRSRQEDQDSATGSYPHAGLLSTFQYLTRYPTTETNRNRLRARMYYQHFLGVDVLELAARVSDAAAVTAKFKVPTMEASECVVCHKTLDPVAGMFQDFWKFADQGVYGKRKGGWFTDMFAAGFEGEKMPASERWRSLQWLGERTAKDPRFAVAMIEHAYYVLT